MKRIFLAGMMFLIGGNGFGRDIYHPATVIGERVNIRTAPSLRAEIVGRLDRDQAVEVIASDGQWCAITPPADVSAWVAADYLREGTVIADRLNVRSGPGVSYAVLARLNKGESPELLEEEGDWIKIALPSAARLWVSARFVRLEGAVPTPPLETSDEPEGEEILPAPRPDDEAPPAPLPAPAVESAGTPFLPRSAPAYTPSYVRKIKSYTGYIRQLHSPRSHGERKISYELVRVEPRPKSVGYLMSGTIDLERYRHRRVNLWAEKVPGTETPLPLLDVKGIQILW